jgi:Flp pilus assembly protein TadD
MKRFALFLATLTAAALLIVSAPARAQNTTSGLRGIVADEQGQPIPDVEIEITYQGEGPKRVYHVKTNKKGGFVRVGLQPGGYKLIFSKEGYKKYGIETWLSLGGLSDICTNQPAPNQPCEDIQLKKAEVAVSFGEAGEGGAAAPGPAAAGQEGGQPGAGGTAAATATAEEAAKLGAAYAQAVEAIKTQQWDAAETALKEVLEKVPGQPVVHFNLGHVYAQKKDWAAAEAEFRKAAELEPAKSTAYIALAALYESQGKGPDAVALLQEHAATFGEDAKFQVALGATAMNQGMEKEAEAAFSKAVELDPSNVEIQYFLASLALNRNEVPDAIKHLEAYLAAAPPTSPNVPVAKDLLAALQQQAKKK